MTCPNTNSGHIARKRNTCDRHPDHARYPRSRHHHAYAEFAEYYYNEVDGRPTIGIGLHDPTLGPFAVELPQQVVWHVAETLAAMIGERDRLQQAWRRDFGQDDSSAA